MACEMNKSHFGSGGSRRGDDDDDDDDDDYGEDDDDAKGRHSILDRNRKKWKRSRFHSQASGNNNIREERARQNRAANEVLHNLI